MPPQSVEVAETIAALKRALRREREAPSNQQITSATNRGNKLKRGAAFVHAGSLPFKFSQHGYKERIEYAGYQRYILSRNPKRFNEYGDELEDSESDQEADADADDENPYSDIRLEELLRPLTHPAELETHPTMSQPYLDPALPDMVKTTEEKLRQERANLWRAKSLHRYFIGDESWVPSEKVEQSDDWDLFDPNVSETPKYSSSKKRKRGAEAHIAENGINDEENHNHIQDEDVTQTDTTMTNGEAVPETKISEGEDAKDTAPDADMTGVPNHKPKDAETNGVEEATLNLAEDEAEAQIPQSETKDQEQESKNNTDTNADADADADADAEESPAPPPRRITRALAATSNTDTPPLSPISSSSADSTMYQVHPIFLLPASLQIRHTNHTSHLPLHVAHSGLAIDEILETRRLIGMYIQKQEETIRGLEGVLGKLIKAKRMRDQLWEWCKAEGHVNEWSDGEDWVDVDMWGISSGELKKGRDEENNEEEEIGRKGKRRRARERD